MRRLAIVLNMVLCTCLAASIAVPLGGLSLAHAATGTTAVSTQKIVDADVSDIGRQPYTGFAIRPDVVVKHGGSTLKRNVDYVVTYKDNTSVGTATAVISGIGSYSGIVVRKFTIVARSISGVTFTGLAASYEYTGSAITPTPTVKLGSKYLKSGSDYTISYKDNVNAGTATMTVTGKGNYTGTVTRNFVIKAAGSDDPSSESSSDDGSTTGSAAKGATMYRLYNPNSGEHFYTSNAKERYNTIKAGWKDEGVGWTAPRKSNTPVYRLYSGTDHHYTTSVKERDNLVKSGWKYEGIGWYSDDEEGVPLYRQYNPNVNPAAATNNSGSHNYTTSKKENDGLVKAGWKAEGIGWYGLKG